MAGAGHLTRLSSQNLWILFFVGLMLITALLTSATTFVPLSFEELAHKAIAVARLRCLYSESQWTGGEIWTETKFAPVETYKGILPELVTVRMPGGNAENFHSHIDGVPQFAKGEEVYLFLWGDGNNPYRVLGWSQGTFRILRDARTQVESVTQDSVGTAIFDSATHTFRRDGVRNISVAAFRFRLKKALERQSP